MADTIIETAPIAAGALVAGKYRVGQMLGQGGMGVVVAATHVQLEQRVALKFLRAETLRIPEVVARFTREAQAAARIQSVHVARVLDVGELPSGVPYIVMEYLEGEDLEQVLRRRGPLPIAEAVDLLLEGCEAVAEAHMLGIVHRDLKPANLFLARYPGGRQIVKVLDFGISKLQGAVGSPGLTQETSMFGSPPYMSPEQVRSTRSADVRSDIWSLGAVLYELLTQTTPFQSESVPATFVAILATAPTPPRALRPEIPPPLEAALLCCLEKDPADRFQDVAPLAAALAPFGSAQSAEVAARISRLVGIGNTRAAPSATMAAAGAPASSLSPPTALLSGPPTAPSTPTRPGDELAPNATQSPLPPLAPAAPVPAIPTATNGPRRRSPLVIALAASAAIVAAGAAYWVGVRNHPRADGPAAATAPPTATTFPPPPAPTAPPLSPPPTTVAAPALAIPAPERRRHPGGGARGREHGAVDQMPAESDGCADLLARLSLGEALTKEEAATYARACKKR